MQSSTSSNLMGFEYKSCTHLVRCVQDALPSEISAGMQAGGTIASLIPTILALIGAHPTSHTLSIQLTPPRRPVPRARTARLRLPPPRRRILHLRHQPAQRPVPAAARPPPAARRGPARRPPAPRVARPRPEQRRAGRLPGQDAGDRRPHPHRGRRHGLAQRRHLLPDHGHLALRVLVAANLLVRPVSVPASPPRSLGPSR